MVFLFFKLTLGLGFIIICAYFALKEVCMTYFLLKALEIIAVLLFTYLNQLLAQMALALVCPPLIPFVGLAYLVTCFVFWQQTQDIFSAAEYDINNVNLGAKSIFEASWSAISAGFAAALWYPSKGTFDVLTGRQPISSMVPEPVSNFFSSSSM